MEKDHFLFKTNLKNENLTNMIWMMNRVYHNSISLVCRGDRMETWQGFSDEVSAVLQFPDYFNMNANSLYECIRDLEWIYKDRIFVFIRDSDAILSKEPGEFLYFFKGSSDEIYKENNNKKIYFIFQNIDKDFPLFENKDLSEYI